MRSEKYDPNKHYEIACSWWKQWADKGWQPIPQEALPKNGVIVYKNDRPICLGFLYSSDSNVAWMEFIISDRFAPPILKGKCLKVLIESILDMARGLGFSSVFTSSTMPSLVKTYEKNGFNVADKDATNLVARL